LNSSSFTTISISLSNYGITWHSINNTNFASYSCTPVSNPAPLIPYPLI
jgi:hypothetical protein